MGRLTRDPEIRYAGANNTAICSFTIAVDREYTKKGEPKEADFFRCKAFGAYPGEFISKYFKKGSAILIRGSIQQVKWEDKNEPGKMIQSVEVVIDKAYFCGSKNTENAQSTGTNQPPKSDNYVEPSFYPIYSDTIDELPF